MNAPHPFLRRLWCHAGAVARWARDAERATDSLRAFEDDAAPPVVDSPDPLLEPLLRGVALDGLSAVLGVLEVRPGGSVEEPRDRRARPPRPVESPAARRAGVRAGATPAPRRPAEHSAAAPASGAGPGSGPDARPGPTTADTRSRAVRDARSGRLSAEDARRVLRDRHGGHQAWDRPVAVPTAPSPVDSGVGTGADPGARAPRAGGSEQAGTDGASDRAAGPGVAAGSDAADRAVAPGWGTAARADESRRAAAPGPETPGAVPGSRGAASDGPAESGRAGAGAPEAPPFPAPAPAQPPALARVRTLVTRLEGRAAPARARTREGAFRALQPPQVADRAASPPDRVALADADARARTGLRGLVARAEARAGAASRSRLAEASLEPSSRPDDDPAVLEARIAEILRREARSQGIDLEGVGP